MIHGSSATVNSSLHGHILIWVVPNAKGLSHYFRILSFNDLNFKASKTFENIVEKGENAGTQHFLIFPQCFLSFHEFQLPRII